MDKKYLMGRGDQLLRKTILNEECTSLNDSFKKELIKLGIKKSVKYYEDFFETNQKLETIDDLVSSYLKELNEATKIGLFKSGGIREKDHLNLWCLGKVLKPKLYIESGIFIGSSFHAFINNPEIEKIIGIDPNLKKLKIESENLDHVKLIDEYDFSQVEFEKVPNNSLVYFDDHINTADRIVQAYNKGIKYLLFDDSTGFEGICQRLYPAIPTIPMIMNWEVLNLGDELNWTWKKPKAKPKSLAKKIKNIIKEAPDKYMRVSLKINQETLEQCENAKKVIKKYSKIPDLGEFIPPTTPEKLVDTSKYLVELDL